MNQRAHVEIHTERALVLPNRAQTHKRCSDLLLGYSECTKNSAGTCPTCSVVGHGAPMLAAFRNEWEGSTLRLSEHTRSQSRAQASEWILERALKLEAHVGGHTCWKLMLRSTPELMARANSWSSLALMLAETMQAHCGTKRWRQFWKPTFFARKRLATFRN